MCRENVHIYAYPPLSLCNSLDDTHNKNRKIQYLIRIRNERLPSQVSLKISSKIFKKKEKKEMRKLCRLQNVYARWSSSDPLYYKGKITRLTKKSVDIQFDDGDFVKNLPLRYVNDESEFSNDEMICEVCIDSHSAFRL